MKKLIILCFIINGICANAQLIENFADNDFTQNPEWKGGDSDWTINAQHQLQSNCDRSNSSFCLYTHNLKARIAEWKFELTLSFNPSSLNYVDVYLIASDSNLLQQNNTGYFVRIGSSDDDISLYRKDINGFVKIIDGANATLNSSSNEIKIRVIRKENNQWEVISEVNSLPMYSEGVVFDSVYLVSKYTGIVVKQSTASFFKKHFLKNFYIDNYYRDSTPPLIDTIYTIDQNKLNVLFNEPVDKISSENINNYIVNNNIGLPAIALRDSFNHALVHLFFNNNFPLRQWIQLTVQFVKDIENNSMLQSAKDFCHYIPLPFDIIIDEIMADPSPSIGLPEKEWLEIKNTSPFDINLSGWTIAKNNESSSPLPAYILQPDSMIVLCSTGSYSAIVNITKSISVTNFPTLSNTEDLIYLVSPQGSTIHTVSYSDKWYQNELKKQGGWSMEMIDIMNPCAGMDNWSASTSNTGGTPGKINSIDAINIDDISPRLIRAFANDSVHVKLYFNEPLDSVQAAVKNNYQIDDYYGIIKQVEPIAPLFNQVIIELNTALERNKEYTIRANGLVDCIKNEIGVYNFTKVALQEEADSFDLIINEVLFNPKKDGFDYVEIYNRSNKTLNLKNIFIANVNAAGNIDNIAPVQKEDFLIFPKEYIVITENPFILEREYYTPNPLSVFLVENMPSFNDDNGTIILLNEQGKKIDQLNYSNKWHFELLDNTEGVSLERIDFNATTQDEHNWHSASSTVGYGTPTYKNSQCNPEIIVDDQILIEPAVISPNNDGYNDIANIFYSFSDPGCVITISIFDSNGKPVKQLIRNQLCGRTGSIKWDGLNENNQKLPIGRYIVYAEVFNLRGKVVTIKKSIVVI